MKKANLDLQEIISAYKTEPNLHKLAKVFHTSHIRLSEILKTNGISIQNVGKRKDVTNDDVVDMISDYLVSHLTMEEISKKYSVRIKKLRSIFRERGVQISKWNGHVKKTIQPAKKSTCKMENLVFVECPICGWRTSDINGKAHSLQRHLCQHHGYTPETIDEYINKYPEHEYLVKDLKSKQKKVQCQVCGKWLSIIDDRHLAKHGMTKSEYIARYGNEKVISPSCKEKLRENLRKMNDNPNWNRFTSSYETEISSFLTEHGIEHKMHDRTVLEGLELDILCDCGVAIEFNGCLQHTQWFGGKDRQYHLSKTKGCIDKNIKLIHVFEDEYVYHKDIVLSKISHILGLHENLQPVYARKCALKEIPGFMAEQFLDANHIQGYTPSTVYLGAYYGDALVGVMTFKRVNADDKKWELTRFATDNNYRCIGLGGKMFNYFVGKYSPEEVKSFADRRWTVNYGKNLYVNLGFRFVCFTDPDYKYYYTKDNKPTRFHKFGFRKKLLLRRFPDKLNENMTETEMARALGYDRIWDCGLIKYVWTKENPGE